MININDFPDEILTHILSFLPIKHAFRTTILSKKWQHLCHSLSVLNIDDEGEDDIIYWINFREFMNTVMLCPCSQYITLKSFHLKCDYDLRDPKAECFSLNKWIKAAKQRGIEYLNLHLLVYLMPTTLFCCKTLVVLKLTNMRVAKMYRCSVDLPSLKTLDLNSVSFHDMENLMRLISGCPILENLITLYVEARADLAVGGGYFKPLSKLINANIHAFVVPLRAVSNVQFLYLFEIRKIIHDKNINSYYKDFPVFGNLIELKLHWTFRDTHDWDEVVKMLQNCPKLQTLGIIKGINSTTGEDWKYPYYVPECVSSHLTTCTIGDFEAFNTDFQFAKYILQNARLLQVLAIFHRSKPIAPQFVEDLFSCPRISPACKLYVSGFSF